MKLKDIPNNIAVVQLSYSLPDCGVQPPYMQYTVLQPIGRVGPLRSRLLLTQ
jgi:hypothetical protein